MVEQVNQNIVSFIIGVIKAEKWQTMKVTFAFSESGSLGWNSKLDDIDFYLDPFDIGPKVKTLREYFTKVKDDEKKHFNKVKFEIFRDGTHKANYYWDEGIIDEQKRKKAQNMAGWLAQRIPTMIAYQGYALYDQFHFKGDIINNEDDANEYGSYDGWRNGVFTFDFRDNNLKTDIEVEKATGRVSIPLNYEEWFINDLWEHYEITNKGMLSNEWKPWNVLEIKLEKDVGHDGGQNIEPEIKYKLIW